MTGRLQAILIALAASTAAGCLGVEVGDVLPNGVSGPPPAEYLYRCSKDAAAEREPCVATLSNLRTAYQEPYVAADPWRPDLYAIGMNAGPSEVDRVAATPEGRTATCQNDLLVTEDGGATWRYVETPRPPVADALVGDYCGGDPALLFGPDGVLHHTGIATANANANGFEIYYTKSADLGATWSDPVVLSEGANEDRNWIARDGAGRLYVTWQHFNDAGGSLVSVSEDNGDTWTLLAPKEMEECFTVSPIAFDDVSNALFACSTYAAEKPGVRVLALDPSNATWSVRAELAGEGYWPKLAWAGETLTLFVERFGETVTVEHATSADGGRTWSAFVDSRAFLPDGFPQQGFDVQWAATDAWGRLHLILAGWETLSAPAGPVATTTAAGFAHAVVLPNGTLLQAVPLGDIERVTDPPRAPETIGTSLGNHYMGLDFNAARGLAVWSARGVLEYAFVEPGAST